MNWQHFFEALFFCLIGTSMLILTFTLTSFILVMREDINLRRMKYQQNDLLENVSFDITDEDNDGWKTLSAIPLER